MHIPAPFRLQAVILAAIIFALATAGSASAAPTITRLSLRGLQSGATSRLTVDGTDLQPNPRLLLDAALGPQIVQPGGTANHLEIEVAIPPEVLPGIYQLRISTARGISSPATIGIDALRQATLTADCGPLPVALTGVVNGSESTHTTFAGRAGQTVVVDVEAKRIGSSLDPVVRLYDSRHTQLAFSPALDSMHGDCRLTAKLPTDGVYEIELQHALFKADGNSFFRLKIGELRYADVAFPLAVERDQKAEIKSLFSNLDADAKFPFIASGMLAAPLKLEPNRELTGPQPSVICSDQVEYVVSEGKTSSAAAPCGINGIIAKRNQEDRIPLIVKPGMKLRIDVLANRAGSPLDGVLTIRGDKGAQLASSDDRIGTCDPGSDFVVPANVSKIELGLKDMQGRGGADYFYRMDVADMSLPDFTLSLNEDHINIPADGSTIVRLEVTRQSYQGPILLTFNGLPAGAQAVDGQIPAGANVALIAIKAGQQSPIASLASISGRGTAAAASIARPVQLAMNSATANQPWLRNELGMAVVESAPLTIAWGETSAEQRLPIGAKLALPVKIVRTPQGAGPVRLSLIHSQAAPPKREVKKPAKPNAKAKPAKVVNDADRLLRLDGMPVIAADKNEGAVSILAPVDLPQEIYDIAIRAELLSVDQKTVLATVFTPVLHLSATGGFHLQLTSSPKVEAAAGVGPVGKYRGKIVRQAGFDAPIRVTLTGLPKGTTVPEITVPADKSDFEFPVQFKYGTKPGELRGVQLVASTVEDDDGPEGVVHSAPVNVQIKVLRGAEPKLQKPLTIFEDDEKFLARLDEGHGVATLEKSDAYSGKASIKVTPDERFTTDLPGLAVKIRENPGNGEYRYLTFAWKKSGGEHLALQINHDGDWGAVDNKPATFRYSAGAGDCFGGTLMIAEKPPVEWTLITRDLFADFGEFTFNGIALSPHDGDFASFDHIYLGHSADDFEQTPPPIKIEKK